MATKFISLESARLIVWNEIENHMKSKKFNDRADLIKNIKEKVNEISLNFIGTQSKNSDLEFML